MTRAGVLGREDAVVAASVHGPVDYRPGARGILARLAGAREVLPVVASAFVILALLALVPVLLTRRRDLLQAAGDATTGRAHVLTDSLKTLFIDEIMLLEQVTRIQAPTSVV